MEFNNMYFYSGKQIKHADRKRKCPCDKIKNSHLWLERAAERI